ncbi:acyl-CoA dehydrogenase family protein [Subtercola boreus]|uniref:acyl-CoA dehydrogenase family protein n=1 Tax=Subtercola boreus TaxID=120213 RepID=UPI000E2F343C|nr:acyl-CoA dehydrogenase family protein [Subtercola boreus]
MTSSPLAISLAPGLVAAPAGWAQQAASWVLQWSESATDPRGGSAPDARGPADAHAERVGAALRFASELGAGHPFPGVGRTAELFEALATVAAADLGAARAIEPHLDALAILDQAGLGDGFPASDSWGVFAAEGGPAPLVATYSSGDATWSLSGTKLWCSLADRLDRALVSAAVAADDTTVGAERRRLFSVDLRQPGVSVEPGAWHARGLAEVPSGPVRFDTVECEPVGEPGWYLKRPGFAWGGIGVAACWFGGAVGVARTVFARGAASAVAPDPLLLMHLGTIDERLGDARRALAEAAALIDAGQAVGEPGRLLAERVRSSVARASEDVLSHTAHALGPAPLALDAAHAKRVADLELYVRQHHAEKDSLSLGRQLIESGPRPW